ncbi:MAG: HAD family hydrolase [Chloroflexota bacterium]|nr:HAD family hydrolase [Chloroflexota bacterium]
MKSSLSGIKAISFDVDGTLWDFEDALRRGLEAALREVRLIDPEGTEGLTVDHLDQAWMVERDRQWGTITDLVKLRHDAMRRAFADIDTPDKDLTNRATDAYLEERNRNSRPFDDVVPGLEALHGMYTLGTLTNGSMRPERLGLEKFFDFIVMSVEHGGIEKPDPRIFEIAVREARCEPHELLHVGDHIEYDVRGANDAGVRSVWLNRIGESFSSGVKPNLEVTSLSELADALLGIKTQ